MIDLVANLRQYRGGCILCIDYRNFSLTPNYPGLVGLYFDIEAVLVAKLQQFQNEGFQPINGFLYGYSFSGNLVVSAPIMAYGNKVLGMVDAVDPAGPLFDTTGLAPADASQAAKNVQCINTSKNLGTWLRTCTQNWLMGMCGVFQPAAIFFQNSHLLASVLYNIAFTRAFPAISRPMYCYNTTRSLTSWPAGYKMGYDESRLTPNTQPFGTLYANTFPFPPYTG